MPVREHRYLIPLPTVLVSKEQSKRKNVFNRDTATYRREKDNSDEQYKQFSFSPEVSHPQGMRQDI